MRAKVLLVAEFDIDGDDPSQEIAEIVGMMEECLEPLVEDRIVSTTVQLKRTNAQELPLGLVESQSGWETF